MKRMLILGEHATPYLADVGIHGLGNDPLQISVAFDELRSKTVSQAKEIVDHENLPITIGSGTNADSRDWQSVGDFMGQIHRHPFEYDGKRTSLSNRVSVFQ